MNDKMLVGRGCPERFFTFHLSRRRQLSFYAFPVVISLWAKPKDDISKINCMYYLFRNVYLSIDYFRAM